MRRLFAIVVACFVLVATTGAQRVVAAHFDRTSVEAAMPIKTADKAPCCTTYKVQKDHHHTAACSLPLVTLPASVDVVNRQSTQAGWAIRAGPALDGVMIGPGEQPPKQS